MELDEKVVDEAGGPSLTTVWFEFHKALWQKNGRRFSVCAKPVFFTIHAVFSTPKALEFVVMHSHSCLSGPVIDGGRGGGHKEEEAEEYKGVGECRL